ncbi:MAG TPA: terminase family protein [Nitrososphaerales archaeon]|nr:terminase family protein [Nitrososphaerales archaeon]
MRPIEREQMVLADPEMFASRVTLEAWHWKNIDPWQREVLTFGGRYGILDTSRQSGKSSILAVKAFYTALTTENALVLLIAEQRQSNEDLRKVRELVRGYDRYLRRKYGGALTCNLLTENLTSLEFANHSRIIALPANEKVRGFSAPNLVVIDEAGWVDDEVFVAIDPMMEVSQGQLIIASTPNGTSGFYYREWSNPRYTLRLKVPWHACPRISKESIASKREIYGEAYVKQEYECEFLDDISALFTEQSLRESIDEDQDVLSDQMAKIQGQLQGEAELI